VLRQRTPPLEISNFDRLMAYRRWPFELSHPRRWTDLNSLANKETSMTPNFQQSINQDRPHTLLTVDVKRSGSLLYRYDDNQEVVDVPNIWYNQTYQTRVASVRFDAKIQDEAADSFSRHPPIGLSQSAIDNVVFRYHAKAARIRSEADRMEAEGVMSHPVRASRMQLDYSVETCS
jgi:hypothetical protein